MNATRKVKLKDITENLTCSLCKGYIIDATTSIECLHSFCKSCIVQHLDKSEFCPVCDVQLHSTKPLSGIRSDQMLQEIIYKLVPGLFKSEMTRRRKFYNEHAESTPSSHLDSGQVFNQLYITSDDKINVSLEYFTNDPVLKEESKRFFFCPAEVSVSILKKLVQGKYDLNNDSQIDIMYGERILPDDFLLMDIAYKYSWTESGTKPLQLCYRVKGTLAEKLLGLTTVLSPRKSPAKRRSRAVTDSEILKSPNRIVPTAKEISATKNSALKTTPSGKPRGRKKKLILNEKNSPFEEVVEVKKKKSYTKKNYTPKAIKKEIESQSDGSILKIPVTKANASVGLGSAEKEVQLHISENGIISARSVGSGEEKIIGNVENEGQEKNGNLPKGENFSQPDKCEVSHSSASASMLATPIHTFQMNNNGAVAMSKPSYVTLNIPTISFGISPFNNANTTTISNSNQMSVIPIPNVNGNGNNESPQKTSQHAATNKQSTPTSKNKITIKVDSAKKTLTNGAKKSITFQDKKANVQKALLDLQKKHFSPKVSEQALNLTGSNSTNNAHLPQNQTTNELTNPLSALPFPLSALASSGMTVNFIPYADLKSNKSKTEISTNNNNNNNQQQQGTSIKRSHHQTTIVNGDLKFASSPRHILPSPSKGAALNGSPIDMSPKKPRKFFKSRHPSAISSSDGESPTKDKQSQLKFPKITQSQSQTVSTSTLVNGHFQPNNGMINSTSNQFSSASTVTTPSCSTTPSTAVPKSSPIVTANQPINPLLTLYQMTSPFNNFAPFVTNDYISMPYVNSRMPYATPGFNFNNLSLPFPISHAGIPNTPNFIQALNSTINDNTTTTFSNAKASEEKSPGSQLQPPSNSAVNGNGNHLSKINGDFLVSGNAASLSNVKNENAQEIEPLSLKVNTSGNSKISESVANNNNDLPLKFNNGKHQLPLINGYMNGNGNCSKVVPKLKNLAMSEKVVEKKVVTNGESDTSLSDTPLNLMQKSRENDQTPTKEVFKISTADSMPNGNETKLNAQVGEKETQNLPIENGTSSNHEENGNEQDESKISKLKVKAAILKAISGRCEKIEEKIQQIKASNSSNNNEQKSAEINGHNSASICNNNNNPPTTPDLNTKPTKELSSNSA